MAGHEESRASELWHLIQKEMLPGEGKSLAAFFSLNSWVEYVGGWCISRALFLWMVYLGLLGVAAMLTPNFALFVLGWLFGTAPIWLPIALLIAANSTWIWYVHSYHLSKLNPILLEIKLPREILKSPRAMELVFTNFWISSGEVTAFVRFWKGGVRPFFSLELCSFGGEIHFYVWTPKKYRRIVETAFYSQYPEVEIYEVEDYATKHVYDPEKVSGFVGEYWKLNSSNKFSSLYPIKTYIDFELDKDPKEELKVEPLAQIFETLSNLKPSEQVWIQFVIRQNGKEGGALLPKSSSWKKDVQAEIAKIRRASSLKPGEVDRPGEILTGFPHPTWSQTEQIKSMERAINKLAYDVSMRHIYWAAPKDMDGTVYTAVRWIWKPFQHASFGGYLRSKYWHNDFDYPWQDWKGIRYRLTLRRGLDAYRRRSGFYEPWKMPHSVMSVEELATVWRFPSSTIKSPGLRRSSATKSEPPANLPM